MHVSRNVTEYEATITQAQFIDFRGTEQMRFGYRQVAIPLKIIAWIRQRRVSSKWFSDRSFVPEPGAGNFVFVIAEAAIVANGVLVIANRSDCGKTAVEVLRRERGGGI